MLFTQKGKTKLCVPAAHAGLRQPGKSTLRWKSTPRMEVSGLRMLMEHSLPSSWRAGTAILRLKGTTLGPPKTHCKHQSTHVCLLRSLFRNNQKCLVSFQQTVQASSSPRPPSHPHIQKEGKLAVHFSEVALLLQGVLALRIRAGKVHSTYKLP